MNKNDFNKDDMIGDEDESHERTDILKRNDDSSENKMDLRYDSRTDSRMEMRGDTRVDVRAERYDPRYDSFRMHENERMLYEEKVKRDSSYFDERYKMRRPDGNESLNEMNDINYSYTENPRPYGHMSQFYHQRNNSVSFHDEDRKYYQRPIDGSQKYIDNKYSEKYYGDIKYGDSKFLERRVMEMPERYAMMDQNEDLMRKMNAQNFIKEQKRKPKIRECSNCSAKSTPSWRRSVDGRQLLCNACGLYQKLHGRARPYSVTPEGRTKAVKANSDRLRCSNCNSTESSYWRKGTENQPLCNHCGLYFRDRMFERGSNYEYDTRRNSYENQRRYTEPRSHPKYENSAYRHHNDSYETIKYEDTKMANRHTYGNEDGRKRVGIFEAEQHDESLKKEYVGNDGRRMYKYDEKDRYEEVKRKDSVVFDMKERYDNHEKYINDNYNAKKDDKDDEKDCN